MPGIVGTISIASVANSSVVHVGDVQTITPISTAKTFAGAGSFNTGDHIRTNTHYNETNTMDDDVVDDSVALNN
ncbi:Spore germination protein PA [Fictibacillus macauensis ZFHKF-1]|uniref:Spore germination protein PA n=1 Tax=Fictibacillus macauensis ZFHKF-1 TaxID=1196324 RepID=I8IYZ9_9BACL|nr:spore germination protein [Fictibacillus macauensis]EIT84711.1 Spore germination protein PA [Fictibacillus macauensis ZFHKF-1]